MLLVITNQTDLACDYLIVKLKEKKIPFYRLNTEEFGSEITAHLFPSNRDSKWKITSNSGLVIEEKNVTGVIFRQPKLPQLNELVKEEEVNFANRENSEQLRSLWRLMDPTKWLNHPTNLWKASNKADQLQYAAEIGFKIPNTCITYDIEEIKNFHKEKKTDLICKSVKHGYFENDETIYLAPTRTLSEADILTIDSFAPSPMIIQEKIPKIYDIRVTIIDNNVYSTLIHSQSHKETEVDWRVWDLYNFDLKHEKTTLPTRISELCLQLNRHYNLRYSAIDLIFSTDQEFFFLELNPNGQWAWIESKVGFPIRDSIIQALMGNESD